MPFTEEQFFEVFQRYNNSVWPAQLGLYAVAIAAVALARRGASSDSRYVAGLLGLLWAWTAVVYHAIFFRQINPAATLFAGLFLFRRRCSFGTA